MLNNAQKAAAYKQMGDRIAEGWVRGTLRDQHDRVCMLGAAQYGSDLTSITDLIELQMDMKKGLHKRHVLLRLFDAEVYMWNDAPWRTRAAVLRFMRSQERMYARRAKADKITELEARVAHLEQVTMLQSHPDLIGLNTQLNAARKELSDADAR